MTISPPTRKRSACSLLANSPARIILKPPPSFSRAAAKCIGRAGLAVHLLVGGVLGAPLVVVGPQNPFGRYYAEILKAEGLNLFAVVGDTLWAGLRAPSSARWPRVIAPRSL